MREEPQNSVKFSFNSVLHIWARVHLHVTCVMARSISSAEHNGKLHRLLTRAQSGAAA